MPRSDRIDRVARAMRAVLLGASAATLGLGGALGAASPQRVVSMNLCTDQLALLVAAPDQLMSVSSLSHDPRSSPMVDAARALPANAGRAEELYMMAPDLVLASQFSSGATIAMLQRLGVEVAIFAPANTFADIADRLRQMGDVLGREARAEALVGQFQADLARLGVPWGQGATNPAARPPPRAALYSAKGYTSGAGTMAGEILRAAGFANVAGELGLPEGGFLPLEILVMTAPDAVITVQPYAGQSRSEELLRHPALAALNGALGAGAMTSSDWACGTPLVVRAVSELAKLREQLP